MPLRALAAQNYRRFSSFLFFDHTSNVVEKWEIRAQLG